MRNRPDATCSMQHATHTRCKHEEAMWKTGKMQQAKLQHATCKKQVATLQHATRSADTLQAGRCNKQNRQDAIDRSAACNKQSCSMQHAKNRLQHCSMRLRPATCERNDQHAASPDTDNMQLSACNTQKDNMQKRGNATCTKRQLPRTACNSNMKQKACKTNNLHRTACNMCNMCNLQLTACNMQKR